MAEGFAVALSTVRNKGQVTIPVEVRQAAQIEEGTVVEFTVTNAGVLMQPKVQVLVDPDDAWFYSSEWQQVHRQAVAELERGEGTFHKSTEEFLSALDKG